MAQVVRFAGGWLFDQVMTGWDVTVLTTDHADSRPLRILGARSVDLECALRSLARGPRPQAFAVCAQLYCSDARVRMLVLEALGTGAADVRLWGDRWPPDLDGVADSVPHQLSLAARAFKAQALLAAAAPGDPGDGTEVFLRGEKPLLSASASTSWP
jgi:hypothetical protein